MTVLGSMLPNMPIAPIFPNSQRTLETVLWFHFKIQDGDALPHASTKEIEKTGGYRMTEKKWKKQVKIHSEKNTPKYIKSISYGDATGMSIRFFK